MSALVATLVAWDVVMKASAVNTKFQQKGESNRTYELTGFAPSGLWMLDYTRRISGGVQLQPLVNFQGGEISRNAIDGVFEFALLGQTRKIDESYDAAEVTMTGRWALNFVAHGGFHYYAATPGKVEEGQKKPEKVTGSTLQSLAGLGMRFDLTDQSAIGFEALYTVISLANSKEDLTAVEAQTGVFYRFEF